MFDGIFEDGDRDDQDNRDPENEVRGCNVAQETPKPFLQPRQLLIQLFRSRSRDVYFYPFFPRPQHPEGRRE